MVNTQHILRTLAYKYGGQFTEAWKNVADGNPDPATYSVQVAGPGFMFKIESDQQKGEALSFLRERTCDQLLWFILQKGVEFVKEQGEIFKMFNPEAGNG
jgi:hypothetical protein